MPKPLKYNWSCRCTPNQHKRDRAPAPACDNCGAKMFTDDIIGDPDARLPPRPVELVCEAPAPSATYASRLDALTAARVAQHEARIRDLEARLAKIESQKRVMSVDDPVKAIPDMSPEQLVSVLGALDRQLDEISTARSIAVDLLAATRSDTDEN